MKKLLIGQKFDRYEVLDQFNEKFDTYYDSVCICLCDCGNIKEVRRGNLLNNSKSCGCLKKELLSKRNKKPNKMAIFKSIITYYKRNAKNRNINWELQENHFYKLILQNCYYCGISKFNKTKNQWTGEVLKHNGVDRKNNNIGYTNKNSVPCCKVCNIGKNNLSFREFNIWLKNIKDKK